jgi:hypothetical protein
VLLLKEIAKVFLGMFSNNPFAGLLTDANPVIFPTPIPAIWVGAEGAQLDAQSFYTALTLIENPVFWGNKLWGATTSVNSPKFIQSRALWEGANGL